MQNTLRLKPKSSYEPCHSIPMCIKSQRKMAFISLYRSTTFSDCDCELLFYFAILSFLLLLFHFFREQIYSCIGTWNCFLKSKNKLYFHIYTPRQIHYSAMGFFEWNSVWYGKQKYSWKIKNKFFIEWSDDGEIIRRRSDYPTIVVR